MSHKGESSESESTIISLCDKNEKDSNSLSVSDISDEDLEQELEQLDTTGTGSRSDRGSLHLHHSDHSLRRRRSGKRSKSKGTRSQRSSPSCGEDRNRSNNSGKARRRNADRSRSFDQTPQSSPQERNSYDRNNKKTTHLNDRKHLGKQYYKRVPHLTRKNLVKSASPNRNPSRSRSRSCTSPKPEHHQRQRRSQSKEGSLESGEIRHEQKGRSKLKRHHKKGHRSRHHACSSRTKRSHRRYVFKGKKKKKKDKVRQSQSPPPDPGCMRRRHSRHRSRRVKRSRSRALVTSENSDIEILSEHITAYHSELPNANTCLAATKSKANSNFPHVVVKMEIEKGKPCSESTCGLSSKLFSPATSSVENSRIEDEKSEDLKRITLDRFLCHQHAQALGRNAATPVTPTPTYIETNACPSSLPARQSEFHKEPNPQSIQYPLRETLNPKNSMPLHSSDKKRIESQQAPYNCGAIKTLMMQDFMCFDTLSMTFSSLVTILFGKSCSGKTAILKAIQFVFDKTSIPEDVIKTGGQQAICEITMNNKFQLKNSNEVNLAAFRPEQYGEEIVLRREVDQNGNSRHSVRTLNGQYRSLEGNELEALLKAFNIGCNKIQFCTVESLTQLCSEEHLFKIFEKSVLEQRVENLGSELEVMKRRKAVIDHRRTGTEQEIQDKRQVLSLSPLVSRGEVAALDQYHRKLNSQTIQLKELEAEMSEKEMTLKKLRSTLFDLMNAEFKCLLKKCNYEGALHIDISSSKFWFTTYPDSAKELMKNSCFGKVSSLSSLAEFYGASCMLAVLFMYLPTPCTCIVDCIDSVFDKLHLHKFWEIFMQLTQESNNHQFVFITRAEGKDFSRSKFRNFVLPSSALISELSFDFE